MSLGNRHTKPLQWLLGNPYICFLNIFYEKGLQGRLMHIDKIYNSAEMAFTAQDIEEGDKRIAEEFGRRLSDAIEMYMLRSAIGTFFSICATFKGAKKGS